MIPKPHLAYTVAFDPPGSEGCRILAKMLVSSLLRTGFGGYILVFRNSEAPLFLVERKGCRKSTFRRARSTVWKGRNTRGAGSTGRGRGCWTGWRGAVARKSALVHTVGENTVENIRFTFGLHMGTFFCDPSALFFNFLEM